MAVLSATLKSCWVCPVCQMTYFPENGLWHGSALVSVAQHFGQEHVQEWAKARNPTHQSIQEVVTPYIQDGRYFLIKHLNPISYPQARIYGAK